MSPDDDGSAGRRLLEAAGAMVGPGVRAWLGPDVHVGKGVVVGAGTVLATDRLDLGDGVRIGQGCDLRGAALNLGDHTEIQDGVTVLAADGFVTGPGGRVETGTTITCRSFEAGTLLYLGHDTSVGYGGTTASTSHVRLGDRVAIGPHSILNANLPITFEDQVGSGSHLTVWTHGFHFGHRLLDGYPATFAPVHIHRNVWLAYHATVLPGVTIGADTIVAAGAVVGRDLPAGVLAGGVPATVKKQLAPRPLDRELADERIAALLRSWEAELTWKGFTFTGQEVALVTADAPAPAARYLLTVEDRPDLASDEATVFELRTGRLTGPLDDLGHDLRDFLRRNALPCGDRLPFRSLPAEPFRRWQELTLPSEPEGEAL
jgi:acetyltransferase-like isoleucine patch superfamily enzyme